MRTLLFLSQPPHQPGFFKASLDVVVAEERALAAVGPNGVVRVLVTACTHLEGRPTGPLEEDRGSNLLPTPAVSFRLP
jgi:hypothetical protein